MKQTTTALLMALGLALPAITFGQEDRPTQKHADPDGPRPEHARREAPQSERGDRDHDRGGAPGMRHMQGDDDRGRGRVDGPEPGGRPGRPFAGRDGQMEGRHLPPPPLFAVLDANHDGVIDKREMKHAKQALRRLDRNGDGEITLMEALPHPPGPRDMLRPHDGPDRRDADRDMHGPGPRDGGRDMHGPRREGPPHPGNDRDERDRGREDDRDHRPR